MPVSIKDVAKEANVSIATVSRVLNNIDVVNEDTKEKVLAAVDKLGYMPNIVARSLKTQKSRTIGIIIPDISNEFYPEVVRGAEDASNIYNYNIILCNTDLDTEKETSYLRVLKEKMVDGIIYMSNSLSEPLLKLLNDLQLPAVLVETVDKDGKLPSVAIDNVKAAFDATEYLIEKGNKRIAYIGSESEKRNASALRYTGYVNALEKYGMDVDEKLIHLGGLKTSDGYNGIKEILSRGKIDALFCVSDVAAMGAINALRESGLRVPEDVDVIGFNDISMAATFYPKLTTIAQPMYDMGAAGMRMLIKIINGESLEQDKFILSYELVKRESCK